MEKKYAVIGPIERKLIHKSAHLPEQFVNFLIKQVKAGRFSNLAEAIRIAIDRFLDKEYKIKPEGERLVYLNFYLTPEQTKLLQKLVKAKRYATFSEAVRVAIRDFVLELYEDNLTKYMTA